MSLQIELDPIVVLTNGCFDVLTVGHIELLEAIKDTFPWSYTIVLLNSDASVRRLKGPSRPINTQDHRARVLSALRCVDSVQIFDEDTPLKAMERHRFMTRNTVVVKGRGYKVEDIIAPDGFIKLVLGEDMGLSSTQTIEKMRR